ncbi:hypothetical protein SAMN06264348_101252 [Oceanospirillum linum]|nr:putative transcriptional regulator [Oleiphilus messinensis]SMP02344.1 hypothetical protein SAMN06264348_101252 [Oceanospirillum linum]
MGDRNLGAEILDGINEIKQFKKGKLALRTHELSEPLPPKVIRLKLSMSQSASLIKVRCKFKAQKNRIN